MGCGASKVENAVEDGAEGARQDNEGQRRRKQQGSDGSGRRDERRDFDYDPEQQVSSRTGQIISRIFQEGTTNDDDTADEHSRRRPDDEQQEEEEEEEQSGLLRGGSPSSAENHEQVCAAPSPLHSDDDHDQDGGSIILPKAATAALEAIVSTAEEEQDVQRQKVAAAVDAIREILFGGLDDLEDDKKKSKSEKSAVVSRDELARALSRGLREGRDNLDGTESQEVQHETIFVHYSQKLLSNRYKVQLPEDADASLEVTNRDYLLDDELDLVTTREVGTTPRISLKDMMSASYQSSVGALA